MGRKKEAGGVDSLVSQLSSRSQERLASPAAQTGAVRTTATRVRGLGHAGLSASTEVGLDDSFEDVERELSAAAAFKKGSTGGGGAAESAPPASAQRYSAAELMLPSAESRSFSVEEARKFAGIADVISAYHATMGLLIVILIAVLVALDVQLLGSYSSSLFGASLCGVALHSPKRAIASCLYYVNPTTAAAANLKQLSPRKNRGGGSRDGFERTQSEQVHSSAAAAAERSVTGALWKLFRRVWNGGAVPDEHERVALVHTDPCSCAAVNSCSNSLLLQLIRP